MKSLRPDIKHISDYTYNYEAALKQLNLKPDILYSQSESVSSEQESSYVHPIELNKHKDFNHVEHIDEIREAEEELAQMTRVRVQTLEQII